MGNSTAGEVLASTIDALTRRLGAKTGIADEIANTLRQLILSGELQPGDRIVESRYAKQLGVGQPTVREALVALEHQGLVSRLTNRGCFVTELSAKEIADVLQIRDHLELLAIGLAVRAASDEQLRALLAVAHEMTSAGLNDDAKGFFARDQVFHEMLWTCSGNSYLPRVLSSVMTPLLAFLFIRNVRTHTVDLTASAKLHVDIVEAMLARDAAKARAVAERALGVFSSQHLDHIQAPAR